MDSIDNQRRLSRKLFTLIVLTFIIVSSFAVYGLFSSNRLTVQAQTLNVRRGPDLSYSVLEQAAAGDSFNILAEENQWLKIRLDNNEIGWVPRWQVNPDSENPVSQSTAVITTETADLRSEAHTESEAIAQLTLGDEVVVLFTENGWSQVSFGEQIAWISNDNLVTDTQAATEANLVDVERVPISEATIVLDPGHGGDDPGAVTPHFYEKQINLETAQRLFYRLQETGANVILTRHDDSNVSLADRANISNVNQADAFISFHYDSTEVRNSKTGTTTYYYDEQDSPLARTVNAYLVEQGILENNGVGHGNYQVLRDNKQPSILVELGYLNHDHDVRVVNSEQYQSTIVEALYQALLTYFE